MIDQQRSMLLGLYCPRATRLGIGNRHPDSECLAGIEPLMPSVSGKPSQNVSLSLSLS
ncbi:hypothetical protein BDD21_0317 [Thiocapsa rosea]|uniref:Uncharacterized protein n=1 Tax=Thiocapsa rosea TaxID=69360 RepID=A0A495V2W1_9GAMM|nr:hypothetical protein BDD21_0317 [Thiocapsa rosea]